jgi:2-dehydropantoate 2-reductase
MRIAVLGAGGVGGLVAGALSGTYNDVALVVRESAAETLAERGLTVRSTTFGDFTRNIPVLTRLREAEDERDRVDALIVATKAVGLSEALDRIEAEPKLVLPLLNGIDHLAALRERFPPDSVLASTIRVESDCPETGLIVHTSRFLLIDMATRSQAMLDPMKTMADTLKEAGVPVRVTLPVSARSEAQVMWSKLVRLNALACTTSAYNAVLGEIRAKPALHADLVAIVAESCAVGRAEGADDVDPQVALAELEVAHDTLGSSMQRDIAAGRPPELDAIPGAVLRAGARHGIECPTIERLSAMIADRAGMPPLRSG